MAGDPPVVVSPVVVSQQLMLGTTEPFILGGDFEVWIDRLNNYFDINKIQEDEFKAKLLMNVIGATASAKVTKSLKPKKFTEFKYKEIEEKCKKLFTVELQALAEHCKFENHLDNALRGRFVTGLRNKKIMQQLLNLEGDLSKK